MEVEAQVDFVAAFSDSEIPISSLRFSVEAGEVGRDFGVDEDVDAEELAPAVESGLFGGIAGVEDGEGGAGVGAAEIIGAGAQAFEVLERLAEGGLAGDDFEHRALDIDGDEIGFAVFGTVLSGRGGFDAPVGVLPLVSR